jgi:hypothetical protein
LHDRSPGYGVVHFNKKDRQITFWNWPIWADPAKDDPYPEWPVICNQEENDGRKPLAFLPTYKVRGIVHPVIKIIDESTGEMVHMIRFRGIQYQPKVFRKGTYTVVIGDPDQQQWKKFEGVQPTELSESEIVNVPF